MTHHYKSVLIGLGNVAYKLGHNNASESSLSHAAAYKKNSQTDLAGGYSPNTEENALFTQHIGAPSFNSLNAMFDTIKPDIVSICSPTECHLVHIKTCFEHKIPMIWLEKPISNNLTDTQQIIDWYTSKKSCCSTVLVNYQRRYTQSYIEFKKLIHSNTYGNVLNLEIRYSKGLLINGSHLLDLLFFFFGQVNTDILWNEATTPPTNKPNSTDNPSFVLLLDKKHKIICTGSDAPYHNIDIIVTFDKARLSILHGGMTPIVEKRVEHELYDGFYRLKEDSEPILGHGGFDFSFDHALHDLIESFQNKRQPISNLVTASHCMHLINRIMN